MVSLTVQMAMMKLQAVHLVKIKTCSSVCMIKSVSQNLVIVMAILIANMDTMKN